MKAYLQINSCAVFFLMLAFTSCNKEEYEQPVFKPNLGIMCTGNGSTSYFPMAIDNEWHYPGVWNNSMTYFIRRTLHFGSHTYFEFGSNQGGRSFYREDSIGNILSVDTSTFTEKIIVPGIPVLNQQWTNFEGQTEKVVSINETLMTSFCTYNECLKIARLNSEQDTLDTRYYKRGIGIVSYVIHGIFTNPYYNNLSGLTLN